MDFTGHFAKNQMKTGGMGGQKKPLGGGTAKGRMPFSMPFSITHIAWASGLIECQILLSTDRGTLHLQKPA